MTVTLGERRLGAFWSEHSSGGMSQASGQEESGGEGIMVDVVVVLGSLEGRSDVSGVSSTGCSSVGGFVLSFSSVVLGFVGGVSSSIPAMVIKLIIPYVHHRCERYLIVGILCIYTLYCTIRVGGNISCVVCARKDFCVSKDDPLLSIISYVSEP